MRLTLIAVCLFLFLFPFFFLFSNIPFDSSPKKEIQNQTYLLLFPNSNILLDPQFLHPDLSLLALQERKKRSRNKLPIPDLSPFATAPPHSPPDGKKKPLYKLLLPDPFPFATP